MRKKLSFFLMGFLLCTISAMAQTVVKGVVVDKNTQETLIGVTVYSEAEKNGTATDLDGSFSLKLKSTKEKLKLTYVGYKPIEIDAKTDLGTIEMETDAIGLSDVVVTSSVAIRRKTPVALSVIEPEMLEAKMSSQEFPEILKSTPGIYATKQGGGYGDSRVNLRGFETENIAIMINGVPMNDMEWGGVYWSNLTGLGDVTRSMQVQRGLGAAKIAAPSIGGSINIVTKSAEATKGGSVSYMMGNDGFNKVGFNVSTGLSKDGWAMTLMGSKTWGDGYIDGTDFEAYVWFANISKIINDKHQLSFTAFGSPQWHNQRNNNDRMRVSEWQKINADGMDKYKFNPTFGYDENGKSMTASRNRYHKPQLSLNHFWTINEKSSLSTSLYVSIGSGGGRRWRGANVSDLYGVSNITGMMNEKFTTFDESGNAVDLQLRDENTWYRDYGIVQRDNRESANGSRNVLTESINNHTWLGLLSTYTTTFADNIDFYGGLDLRYYEGTHREKLKDLMGGKFFIDPDRKNVIDPALKTPEHQFAKLKPGDDVYRNNIGYVLQTGAFAQAEYNKDALSAFVSGSLTNSAYWKRDKFYYDNVKTKKKSFLGFSVKGGANYNINEQHNVFFNTGYMSRAPYMRSYFTNMDRSNEVNPKAKNEKSYSVEVGYGFRSKMFTANVNLYHTKWLDKTMVSKLRTPEGDNAFMNLTGVDAKHQGVELEFTFKPIRIFELKGMLSIGDWKWDSRATGQAYDNNGNMMTNNKGETEGTIDLKGVRVGNSAQTQFNIGGTLEVFKGFKVGADYNFQARNYSKFKMDAPDIGNIDKYYTPWRMPSYGTLDIRANYKFDIGPFQATIFGNVNNLLDTEYIADATDFSAKGRGDGNWENVGVFYGFGRTYTVSMKVKF